MDKILTISVIALVACFGCSREESEQRAVSGDGNGSFPALADDAVIVKVNGRSLDKQGLERLFKMRFALLKVQNPMIRDEDADKFRWGLMMALQRQFMPQTLYLTEAEKLKIVPTPEDREAARQEISLNFGSERARTFPAIERNLKPDEREELARQVETDAKIIAYWRRRAPEAFRISAEEFAAVSNDVRKLNARADELLLQQRKLAKEVYAELTNGLDFAEVANRHSVVKQEDEGGYVWGSFFPASIPYPQLIPVVAGLFPGDFTEPIELEDGIHIIKLLKREGSGADSAVNLHPEEVTLGRIVLNLPQNFSVATEAKIRQDTRKAKLEPLQKDWLKELRKKAAVEYPSGTNVWSFVSRLAARRRN